VPGLSADDVYPSLPRSLHLPVGAGGRAAVSWLHAIVMKRSSKGEKMPAIESYQGFETWVYVIPLYGTPEKQCQPVIRINREHETKSITYSPDRYFSTEEEAMQFGAQSAREIIDGKVEGFSVTDL
jgi:hypothetical protein